jgi:hypothetical protein
VETIAGSGSSGNRHNPLVSDGAVRTAIEVEDTVDVNKQNRTLTDISHATILTASVSGVDYF